jgi:LmbE family N-acetylglucosaminyl deacetylase
LILGRQEYRRQSSTVTGQGSQDNNGQAVAKADPFNRFRIHEIAVSSSQIHEYDDNTSGQGWQVKRNIAFIRWIYLSPHLDDAAFSCGGLIWEQAQAGLDVQIWTVCAGDPPEGPISPFAESLHRRWKSGTNSGQVRRQEDLMGCEILGATANHLPIPDSIYRRQPESGEYLYASEESLFGELHPAETELVERLAQSLRKAIWTSDIDEVNLVCPLGLGGHVDHQLTRAATEKVSCSQSACATWYYADFPYVLEDSTLLSELPKEGWQPHIFPITPAGLRAWQRSMAAHGSQISTFWDEVAQMEASIEAYCRKTGGVRLWRKREPVK